MGHACARAIGCQHGAPYTVCVCAGYVRQTCVAHTLFVEHIVIGTSGAPLETMLETTKELAGSQPRVLQAQQCCWHHAVSHVVLEACPVVTWCLGFARLLRPQGRPRLGLDPICLTVIQWISKASQKFPG